MEVESVLVTGANRGIGLELIKQIVELPKSPRFVFASYRDESTSQALKKIRDASKRSQVILIKMDITEKGEIDSARKIVESKLGDRGLNLLINNAGAVKREGFPEITEEDMIFHFTVNAVGPVLVLKEMLPLLQKAAAGKNREMNVSRAAILNISSMAGSIENVMEKNPKHWVKLLAYSTSKAVLNMATRMIAFKVKEQGILLVNMCPGRVKTDMGTQKAELTPEESISAMLNTLSQLNELHHGTFMDRNGKTIPF